jgi:hypothetical protein
MKLMQVGFEANTPTQAVQKAHDIMREKAGTLIALLIKAVDNQRVHCTLQYIIYEFVQKS